MNARPKIAAQDLALLGGEPLFDETIHVGAPAVADRQAFYRRLDQMLDRNWLTNNGPMVRELEDRIASLLGVEHCVAMCNGTVALEIAIRALELEGEVIVPSFTFIASAHALYWQGIRPVFCDIKADSHCIDSAEIERHITPRTTGILGVNVWGRACDFEELQEIADRHHLQLLFDSAHSFGASHRGRMLGSFGRCEVLSFHATKCFNTLEGGAVVTNEGDLAEKIRLMRNFGFIGLDRVIYIGTNGKMTEASAAMGLTNLDHFPELIEVNRRNYIAYQSEFAELPGVVLERYDPQEASNYQYIVARIGAEFPLSRDLLHDLLHAENVRVRRYFWPGCHRMEPYRTLYPNAGGVLPVTERVAGEVLIFPTGQAVNEEKIRAMAQLMRFLAAEGAEVEKWVARRR